MKRQEIFETVAKHLFNQGEQALSPGSGYCRYKTPDGLKCAVGILIPDEQYDEVLEEKDVSHLIAFCQADNFKTAPVVRSFKRHAAFLTDLQNVHDSSCAWESEHVMRTKLEETGRRYKLKTDFLADLHFPNKEG